MLVPENSFISAATASSFKLQSFNLFLEIHRNFWKFMEILQTMLAIIFREFLIIYQIFFLPQVKRDVIISNKNGI